jgi:hypothetical protein
VGAAVGLIVVAATDQILPATTAHQAEMRIWLASRAAGFAALLMLTVQIALGLVLSHPTNKSTWRLSKRLFPWHENAWIFVLAFLSAHVISLVVDPYAGVGVLGAFVPGLSSYRSAPVALGTLALWALLATGATARYTRLLPPGAWLSIHRPRGFRPGVGARTHGWNGFAARARVLPGHRGNRPRRQRLPLLGLAGRSTHLCHIARGGLPSMSVNRRLRRPLVVLGVLLSLFLGAASIRAAAAWTAASAPLADRPPSVESLQAELATEQARSRALQTHLDQLNSDSVDLMAALATASDRIAVDASHAKELQDSLAAAKAKLAALEKSIGKARAAAARSGAGAATPARAPGSHEETEDD